MKRASVFLVVALLLLASFAAVPPAKAYATVDEVVRTCNYFYAKGTTDQPYVTVEVWNWINEPSTWVDHVFVTVPSNGDGTFKVEFSFDQQPEGTQIYYWLWGSPNPSTSSWDGEAWYDSGAVSCTQSSSGPPLPKGFVLHAIQCDVAVHATPAGSPIEGAMIRAGQTWFVNPVSVEGSDGQQWTEIFTSGRINGYIPTSCVGGAA